jgi:hypothetical protein
MKKLFSLLTLALLTLSAWASSVTFDFTTNGWNLPVGSDNKQKAAAQFSNNGYTITLEAADGYYWNNTGNYLMLGKQNSTLTFPAFDKNVTKIEVEGTSTASENVVQNIYVGDVPVSTATTGAKDVTNVYEIAADYQAAGNIYVLKVTSKHNTQISSITITFDDGDTPEPTVEAPVFNPNGAEFTSSLEVSLTCATPNAEIQYYECDPVTHEIDWTTYHYYTQPFYVNETKTFAAYASKGNEVSEYTYATFTKVLPTCATPTFTPASGATFEDTETVRIDCATEGAMIVYSVNNGETQIVDAPAEIELSETSTITAFASADGYLDSQTVTATFTKAAPYTVGGTATFVAGVDEDPNVEYRNEADLTIAKDNVTMKFHGTQYNYYTIVDGDTTGVTYTYRIYKNKNIKFTSAAGNIRKIVFDCEENNPVTGFNAVEGLNMENATWEGNAREVTFTAGSKQVRCYSITVTLDDDVPSIIVADPVFDPGTGAFTARQDVNITCETEGAQIYYSMNDGDYQLYTSAITVTEDSTVLKAYAELNGAKSNEVTAKYYKRAEVATIAEANQLKNKKDFVFYGNVVVVYQNGSNLFIKDETGNGLIYGSQVPTFEVGTVLNEEWEAQHYLFRSKIHEYQYPTNVTASDEPLQTITATEYAEAALTTDNINERVIVKGLTLTAGEDAKYLYTADGMAIYNQFGITYPTIEEGATYDVEGMVSYYDEKVQIMPIAVTKTESLRGDVNNDHEVNVSDAIALINAIVNDDTTGINIANANVNGDDDVNISDAIMLINYVLNSQW